MSDSLFDLNLNFFRKFSQNNEKNGTIFDSKDQIRKIQAIILSWESKGSEKL